MEAPADKRALLAALKAQSKARRKAPGAQLRCRASS